MNGMLTNMDMEGSNLRRVISTSTPFLLGTGSTGMLLISNNPLGEQSASKSYRGLDKMSDRFSSSSHHRSSVDHLLADSLRSPNRSVGGHSDSGISNGMSVSSGSRYKPDSSLERNYHDYGHLDIQKEQYSSPNRHLNLSANGNTNNTMNSPSHRFNMSHVMSDADHCSTGRSHSMTRLNMLSSQDWKSSSSGSPSRCSVKTRTGSSLQETNGENMHHALEESEDRRHLLVDRLRDAQETIKFQAQRIAEIENSARDTSVSVDELRFKEKELLKKISMLEREKNSYYEKHMESLKAREQLQHRIESLSTEVASLRTTMELVQCDLARKDKTIAHLTSSVNELEESNDKLAKSKDALLKELNSARQSLDLCRSHSEYLEGQDKEYRSDIDRLREENQALIIEKRSLAQKIAALETKNYTLSEDNKMVTHSLRKLTDEKQQLNRQLDVLQDTITDLKSTLAVTVADKERFFQEKLELANQLQKNSFEKENWEKLHCGLEEQVAQLTAELAQMRKEADKYSDERRKHEDELTTVKQVSDVLSAELSKVKTQLENSLERNKSLEQTKMMALKQHELYEQEIQSLETQLKQHKQTLSSLKEEHQKDKDSLEQYNMKIKEELQEVRSECNQLEIRCHEAEAKLRQAEQNLVVFSNDQQKEVQNWKGQCEKLTAANSRKEMETEVLNRRVQDLENQIEYLKVNHDSYQTQFEELTEARSELKRLQEENRRLLQERAENQQVIQLLEMQKDILAKNNEGSLSKIKDVEQLQYTVEQLIVEKQQLQEQLNALESQENERKKEESLSKGRNESCDLPEPIREQIGELEAQNDQLKDSYSKVAEKLTTVEQEKFSLQTKYRDSVSRSEYSSLERNCEQLKRTIAQLEGQLSMVKHQNEQLQENNNKKMVNSQDMWAVQKQREDLANQVSMLSGQVSALEDEKQEVINRNTQLQKQLDTVHEKLFNLCHEDNTQVTSLEKQVKQLKEELENSKQLQMNQENVIESLKEELEEEKTKKPSKLTQSLDAVGEDLTAVRTELHKLGDVIQSKDLQIEDLERQLVHFKKQLADKEKQIEILTTGTGSGKDETDPEGAQSTNKKTLQRQLEERVEELEDEKDELSQQTVSLRKQCDLTRREIEELKETLEEMKKVCDNEHIRQLQKLRKDIAAKDRQIESLEEQLRRHTNVEIKKLKRGASKVELLKAENRRLQSQLSSPTGYVPKLCDPPPVRSSSPSKPSSIGIRLGERLQGNLASSSPSQRLLTRLYGDEIFKDSMDASEVVSEEKDEGSSNSWEYSSSEDDAMSPSCATEEIMSPVGIAKELKKTNDELKFLQTKRPIISDKPICVNGLKADKNEMSQSIKMNGHDQELSQKDKNDVNSSSVNGHDLIQDNNKDAECVTGQTGFEKKRQSWKLAGENIRTGDVNSPLLQFESNSRGKEALVKPKSILKSTSKYDNSAAEGMSSVLVPIKSDSSPTLAASSNSSSSSSGGGGVVKTPDLARSLALLTPAKYQGPPPPVPPKPIMKRLPKSTFSESLVVNDQGVVNRNGTKSDSTDDLLPRPSTDGQMNRRPEGDSEKLPSGGILGKLPGVQLGTITERKKMFPWKSNKSHD